MSSQFTMKQGDVLPNLVLTLYTGTDPIDQTARVNLTTATSVQVFIRLADTGAVLTKTATALAQSGATLGQCSVTWNTGDTDHIGVHEVEARVTWPTARPQTFPASGYASLAVTAKIA